MCTAAAFGPGGRPLHVERLRRRLRRRHRRPPCPRTTRRGAQIGRLIPDPVAPARQGRRSRNQIAHRDALQKLDRPLVAVHPGQALDAARLGTRCGRHRPSLTPGCRAVGRSPSSCSGASSRAGGCRSAFPPCRTVAGLLRLSGGITAASVRASHDGALLGTDHPGSRHVTGTHRLPSLDDDDGRQSCKRRLTLVRRRLHDGRRAAARGRERQRGRRFQALRKSVTCLVKALACWKRKAWPASP